MTSVVRITDRPDITSAVCKNSLILRNTYVYLIILVRCMRNFRLNDSEDLGYRTGSAVRPTDNQATRTDNVLFSACLLSIDTSDKLH